MDANKPLVSIIVNCFNGEKYLRQALDSVLAQTYENFEIVFWDNQSTDSSAGIYCGYGDGRLHYFYAPTHTVLYEARNYAVAKARGDFLAFLDTDDWWEPEKLEKQLALFANPAVGLVYGNYWLENERKGTCSLACQGKLRRGDMLSSLLEESPVGLLTIVVRRAAFSSLPYGFNSKYHIIGDFDFLVRLVAKWQFDYVADAIAHYRWHGGNESMTPRGRSLVATELHDWVEEMRNRPDICDNLSFRHVENKALYAQGLALATGGRRLEAMRLLRRLPFGGQLLRVFAAIVLPALIVDRLRA